MKLHLLAGKHNRGLSPLEVRVPRIREGRGEGIMTEIYTGVTLPFQWETRGEETYLSFISPPMFSGEKRIFELEFDETFGRKVSLFKKEGKVEVRVGDTLFTAFNYSQDWVRPFLFPVISPSGKLLVRELLPNTPDAEHPHHRGIWTAHGDINGVDNWSEMEGHGYQITRKVEIEEGCVFSCIKAEIDWTDADKKENLKEWRTIKIYSIPGIRFIDFEIVFQAEFGEVKFGDTKEGGILSLRVNPTMNASGEGILTNSWGGVNEEEVWGRRAFWCDYSGPIDGEWWGISVFDHPDNPRYPTNWHARNYGLMTANHFGRSYFYQNKSTPRGDLILRKGESLKYRYRLYIHPGDARTGEVREKYLDYIVPPRVETL